MAIMVFDCTAFMTFQPLWVKLKVKQVDSSVVHRRRDYLIDRQSSLASSRALCWKRCKTGRSLAENHTFTITQHSGLQIGLKLMSLPCFDGSFFLQDVSRPKKRRTDSIENQKQWRTCTSILDKHTVRESPAYLNFRKNWTTQTMPFHLYNGHISIVVLNL